MLRIPHRLAADADAPFPPATDALRDPDGLLAVGGDLSPARLLNAYAHGIFPWFSEGQPILWWSPDPRTVFRTDGVHLSRRFRRVLHQSDWIVQADTAFAEVMRACAASPRPGQDGTCSATPIRSRSGMAQVNWSAAFTVSRSGGCSSAKACSVPAAAARSLRWQRWQGACTHGAGR